jgi:hypothetical protein
VALLGVFPGLYSGTPTLSFGRCCEPNSPPGGAISVVFSGDPFIDIVCKQYDDSNQIINSIGNFN